jgi:hypothetical protein
LTEQTPFRTEQLRLETGERFVLTLGADGMPVWWPNLFCTVRIRSPGKGFSTMQAKMSAICAFHNVCARLGIDIDARIESLEPCARNCARAIRKRMDAAPPMMDPGPAGTRTGRTD